MPPFPLHLESLIGSLGVFLVYLAIGFSFGYVLEIAGFAHSPKLAAQFYFKDLTVLKVMFTGIIVAMVLIFFATALGLLDYNLIWVNPTYLWPGIIGGLIMGVGFILGGFCPGTSLVALSTFKLDGAIFALGVLFGIFVFGETVDSYAIFWNSSYLGRFTLPELFGVSTGVVVIGVVLMALFMFWGGEQLERIIGKQDLSKAPKARYYAAGGLVALAVLVGIIGQPTTADRWARIAPEKQALLDERAVQIAPAELLNTIHDHKLNLIMLDVRPEAEYNLYHLADSRHVPLNELDTVLSELQVQPANTVFIVMSNGETLATEAWRTLISESIPNVYILAGGLNNWIETFADPPQEGIRPVVSRGEEELHYDFYAALGAAYPSASPDPGHYEHLEYTPKIELDLKRGPTGGGCG
jgi:rhodanese-related sulfurtransferase